MILNRLSSWGLLPCTESAQAQSRDADCRHEVCDNVQGKVSPGVAELTITTASSSPIT